VIIEVEDNGRGIPEEESIRAFGGFQIHIESGNRYGTGSGSDRVSGARPGTVSEITFTYAQLQADAGIMPNNMVDVVVSEPRFAPVGINTAPIDTPRIKL
jgi:hypothetical protein